MLRLFSSNQGPHAACFAQQQVPLPGTNPLAPCLPFWPCPQHADDTAAAVDVPEAPAHTDKAVPTPAEAAALEMQSTTPLPSASAAVAGLTPASECCVVNGVDVSSSQRLHQ
jgi:hypothetical protein